MCAGAYSARVLHDVLVQKPLHFGSVGELLCQLCIWECVLVQLMEMEGVRAVRRSDNFYFVKRQTHTNLRKN